MKISTTKKNIRNTKVVYLHEGSLILLLDSPPHATLCFIVIRKQFCAMWKKQHVQQTVLWLFLGFTLPLSTLRMINKQWAWNKRGGWPNSPKLINGECWKRLGRVEKNEIIIKRRVLDTRGYFFMSLIFRDLAHLNNPKSYHDKVCLKTAVWKIWPKSSKMKTQIRTIPLLH